MGRTYEQIRKDKFNEHAETTQVHAKSAFDSIDQVLDEMNVPSLAPLDEQTVRERLHSTGDFLLELEALLPEAS